MRDVDGVAFAARVIVVFKYNPRFTCVNRRIQSRILATQTEEYPFPCKGERLSERQS